MSALSVLHKQSSLIYWEGHSDLDLIQITLLFFFKEKNSFYMNLGYYNVSIKYISMKWLISFW